MIFDNKAPQVENLWSQPSRTSISKLEFTVSNLEKCVGVKSFEC